MTILSKIAYMHAVEIMLVFTRPRILGVVPTVGEKGVALLSNPSARLSV